ncbi:MAG: aminoglycoside phosphotransferase family protein [Chloroflexi bacterium]|nr:aminoglycoside phosphotransferase family protein [Chloroflexota bacterium]MCL5274992.1 aminoglycoside phosphotransferase family protein [Chloroflexota bacterium]
MSDSLVPLLDHLAADPPRGETAWQGWRIAPVAGGANNLLYRATGDGGDYAIKFTVRDERRRALREYTALKALRQAGLTIAPRAVWLDEARYRQPVVVQTWLEGEGLTAPPACDADWYALLEHYCAIHAVTPEHTSVDIGDAVLNLAGGAAGKRLVQEHAARLPVAAQPDSLRTVLAWIESWTPPEWDAPPRALCRVDANWRNFIRRPAGWASVDWENSGWGDPAFEIVDLITHPAYADVPVSRWEPLCADYAEMRRDTSAVQRIRTYTTIMRVWWVVRGARYLYEAPRGLDARLVSRPDDWLEDMRRKYDQFVARAEEHIAALR